MLRRADGDRGAGRCDDVDASRRGDGEARRHVDHLAGETVDMEAADAADVLAEILAAGTTGLAGAAGLGAEDRHHLARRQALDALAGGGHRAGGLDPDDDRQLAAGEGHAAPAPHVDVVEGDRADLDLHLAGAGRRWIGKVDDGELAAVEELEGTHATRDLCDYAGSAAMIRQAFWPPKPKEFDRTTETFASRAWLGTTSSSMVGSGTL